MAHVTVPLTSSCLPTAFTRSHSHTVKQVHKFDKETEEALLENGWILNTDENGTANGPEAGDNPVEVFKRGAVGS